jgi:hypothetical protein
MFCGCDFLRVNGVSLRVRVITATTTVARGACKWLLLERSRVSRSCSIYLVYTETTYAM